MNLFEEKYRKKAGSSGADSTAAEGTTKNPAIAPELPKEEYKAYSVAAHTKFNLWMRPSSASKHAQTSIPYSRMNHMITDGNGFVISLHYDTPVISVVIHGRNLVELHDKLLEHEVHWIAEFDARKWAMPPEHEPCITGIEINRKPLPEQAAGDTRDGNTEPNPTARH